MAEGRSVDDWAASKIESWSQGVSRRGWIVGVTSLVFKIVGVTAIPLLPVDRAYAQQGGSVAGCFDWRMCGIHGFFCTSCCGGGGGYWTCPSCTTQDSFWSACCDAGVCPTYRRVIRYYDCCAPNGQALDCTGTECPPGGGSGTPAYCLGGREFRCTIIQETSSSC